jgi:hypothetical protein
MHKRYYGVATFSVNCEEGKKMTLMVIAQRYIIVQGGEWALN